jgi:transcriptional regulator with XRE-family HTH domain
MGLSQARLAKLLKVNPVTVKSWERGKTGISGLNLRRLEILYRVLASNNLLVVKSDEALRALVAEKLDNPPPLPRHARDAFAPAAPKPAAEAGSGEKAALLKRYTEIEKLMVEAGGVDALVPPLRAEYKRLQRLLFAEDPWYRAENGDSEPESE